MLIDNTYFDGLLDIPNVAEPEPNNRSANLLADVIDIAENSVLSYAFGKRMWEDIKLNYNNNTLSDEYKSLIYGTMYERDENYYNWVGIINKEQKTSFLADYAYWLYHTHTITQSTENGESAPDVKVGVRASSTPKVTSAWNRFIEVLNGTVYSGGISGYTPEGNRFWFVERRLGNGYGVDYYGYNSNGGDVSLLQFLKDFKEDYPLLRQNGESKLWGLEFKNSFGV